MLKIRHDKKGPRERLYKNSREMEKHMKGILNDGSQKRSRREEGCSVVTRGWML